MCIFIQSFSFASTHCESKDIDISSSKFSKHYLTFENFGYRFKGRCRGHSLVTQKTYYLMEFGKGENPYNCSKENFPFECQKLYFDKFADIFFNNKVVAGKCIFPFINDYKYQYNCQKTKTPLGTEDANIHGWCATSLKDNKYLTTFKQIFSTTLIGTAFPAC